jgi:hypothetical protein
MSLELERIVSDSFKELKGSKVKYHIAMSGG